MENSIDDRFILLSRIAEVYSLGLLNQPIGLLAHAVLNSIDLKELIYVFRHEETGAKWVADNICKRISRSPNKTELYDYLFEALKSATYIDRLRLRKPMDVAISDLDETRKMEYFSFFFRSVYRYERRAAINLAKSLWNDQIEGFFLENYYLNNDNEVLEVLIEKIDEDKLLNLLRDVYSALPRYLKGKVVNRLKGKTMEDLAFLKDLDPLNYLRLAGLNNNKLSDQQIMDCYQSIPEKYRPFALYNIGLIGKWPIVKQSIELYLADPLNSFIGFDGLIFEH